MDLLGGVLGALLTCAAVLGALRLRPAPARVLGALGWPAWIVAALWPVLMWEPEPSEPLDPLTIGFSNIFLILGLLVGLVCALPRRRRWPGEAVWVSWGVGLLAVLALSLGGLGLNALLVGGLPPEQRGAVTLGLATGLLLSLLPALAAAELVGRRERWTGAEGG
ncbi:hypothetical protein F8S09_07850 [Deinococcus sp. SDU3-2]|uniref:Uncharacterized protein n=1 Tax=Deinococcus terrestris TaxID=2651870 RepID=A0A7X1NVK1_9DEIO|nr:hypothetical protein [Deinococcus terrestris]MPY66608.1 hypothetical protein [Deinococcus terrestris]